MDCEFLDWTPEYVLFLTKEDQLLMDDKYDQYGDSYLKLATVESLQHAMNRVELDVCSLTLLYILYYRYIFFTCI